MMRVVGLVVLLGFTILVSDARAQIGYAWTFEDLTSKADVIVIAEFTRATDTGREAIHPGLSPAFPVVEMRGEFRVASVLKDAKGSAPAVGANLDLFYYRPDMARWQQDHPAKAGQPPPGLVNAGSALELQANASYLLFLAPGPGGAYQPLSGHTFPHDSVYLLWNQGSRCPTSGCS